MVTFACLPEAYSAVKRPDANEIWSEGELCDILDDSTGDGRMTPAYEFRYKQAIETTDMYLGLDPMGKNPTSTACEDLVLLVTLPDVESATSIDVDLTATSITLLTAYQCASDTELATAWWQTHPDVPWNVSLKFSHPAVD